MLYENKCIGCKECLKVCPKGLHSFKDNGEHIIDRANCIACGECAESCAGAIELCGKEMSVDEVITEVMKDASFYKNSGGGMTLSGGDPFMQHEFSLELLKAAKEKGLHTCIETCGYVSRDILERFIPYVDIFLWDVKESDEERHKKYTGVSNVRILENLKYLDQRGAKVILRCPIIPEYNLREEHLLFLGELAESLACVQRVEIEPYHPLGSSKSQALGIEYPLGDMGFLEKEETERIIAVVSSKTKKTVKKA
jgi:pyruvate formate lyase activating enzyme